VLYAFLITSESRSKSRYAAPSEESYLATTALYNSLFRNLTEGFAGGALELSDSADSEDDSATDSEIAPHLSSFTPVQ